MSSLALAGESAELPVHLEESHAGEFYHLVEALPLNEPHTLVLIDAHSDASGIADSDAVREAGAVADFVIVMPHWRTEHRLEPDERQLRFAQSLFEAGADLIVSSGPHVVQLLQHTRSAAWHSRWATPFSVAPAQMPSGQMEPCSKLPWRPMQSVHNWSEHA